MPTVITPTDLRGWRLSLGIDTDQAADLYAVLPATVRAVERGRQKKIFQNWIEALQAIDDAVQDFIDAVAKEEKNHILIVYPNDEDFAAWEPHWANAMHFASVHAMAATSMKFDLGYPLTLLEFSDSSYWDYVRESGLTREEDHRAKWASLYIQRYSILTKA